MATAENKGISIFLRILFVFLLVNIATSSILIVLAYNFSRESVERRTKENIAQQIDTIHQIFSHQYIGALKRSLSTIAASTALNDYLQASVAEQIVEQKKLERMFVRLLKDFDDFQGASFVDGSGDVMIEVVDKARRRERINFETDDSDPAGLLDAMAYDASAQLFRQLKSIPVLLSSGNMEWFMPPREMKVSRPFVDRNGTVSFVAGLAKIDLDTGSFGGVVMLRKSLGPFLAALRDVTFFDENPIWVFDANGQALQWPEKERVTFDPTGFLKSGFQGSLEIVPVERGMVAYQDFAITPGEPFLRVAVAIPPMLLLKDFAPAIQFFSLVLAGSLLVVSALAFYVSRYLSNPIVELAAAAARLAGGNLETRVEMKTTGEVQVLVESFNRMTEQLRETIASREQSVRSLETEVVVRKRAEGKLKRQAEEITRARIAAEDASRAKSSFLAKMSHEIRTPMIGVLGMTDLLRSTDLGPRQKRLVGILQHSAETLLNIINDILDFSRIEAGKMTLDKVDFDLRELVSDVAELLSEPAHSKTLEIVYSLEEEVPAWLSGDPQRLRQVLMNLIGNSIKFTEHGEVEITVAQEATDGEAITLLFRVRDTGIGINLDERTDLFAAFEQADSSISHRYGGTGLGLSIAHQLVTMMGGRMGVESARGSGSTFWFTATFGQCSRDEAEDDETRYDLSGVRILLADDSAANRTVLSRYLCTWGCRCDEVASGEQALSLIRDGADRGDAFDVVVLDMEMPGLGGLELARIIKSSEEIAETDIVLLTSLGWDAEQERQHHETISAFLTKPVRARELRRQVARIALDLPEPAAEAPLAETAGPAQQAGPSLDLRLLLAEDNHVNQEVAREFLEDLGCGVEIVETGTAAVKAWAEGGYDAILLDCQMPEMDGYEAARQIREQERRLDDRVRTPIIAVTAFVTAGERERCLAAGMDDYLSKPFNQEQLRSVLLRWAPLAQLRPKEPASNSDHPGMPTLDREVIAQLRSFDERTGRRLLAKLTGVYLAEAPVQFDQLAEAVAREDGAGASVLAHGLKTSSANLGLAKLAGLLKSMEQKGRENALNELPDLLAQVQKEFDRGRAALASEVSTVEEAVKSA